MIVSLCHCTLGSVCVNVYMREREIEREGRREGKIGRDGGTDRGREGEREIETGFGGKLLHIFTQWAISSFSFFIVLSSFY